MKRKSNLTHVKSIEIIFVPDEEKIKEAIKIAAQGYRRLLLKKIKSGEIKSE